MKVCKSCGRQNPDDHDFCECGEYLRWERTAPVTAVPRDYAAAGTGPPPESGATGPAAVATGPPAVSASHAAPGSRSESAALTRPQADFTANPGAAPPAPTQEPLVDPYITLPPTRGPSPSGTAEPATAAIGPLTPPADAAERELDTPPAAASLQLRLPSDDEVATGPVEFTVGAGAEATLLALIRNESQIVDNYDLMVSGLAESWWSVTPATVYLSPFGSSGTWEQEVQIRVHPPRSPDAEARPWALAVVARSRAASREVARGPATAVIEPYDELATELRPERASGRWRAGFVLTTANNANAETNVWLRGRDKDGECLFHFEEPVINLPPGAKLTTPFSVFPPRQVWIGRPLDRQIEITGTPVDPGQAEQIRQLPQPPGRVHPLRELSPLKKRLKRLDHLQPPQELRQLQQQLKPLERGRAPGHQPRTPDKPQPPKPPTPPRLGTFRQRPWLPWWLSIVVPLAAAIVALLLVLLPKTTRVPSLSGETPFHAELVLNKAGLKLGSTALPPPSAQEAAGATPGTIVLQQPPAGSSAKRGSPVSVSVATGAAKTPVPSVVGQTPLAAVNTLQRARLALGTVSPQPVTLNAKIISQSPSAGQSVAVGSPVQVSLPANSNAGSSSAGGGSSSAGPTKTSPNSGGQGGSGHSGGGGSAALVTVPTATGGLAAVIGALTKAHLGRKVVQQIDSHLPGTVLGTDPAPGQRVPPGTTVQVNVAAGYLAYSNTSSGAVEAVNLEDFAQNVLSPLPPASVSDPQDRPAWSADGRYLAFIQGGQLSVLDTQTPAAQAQPDPVAGSNVDDPAFAPTPADNVIAFISRASSSDGQICIANVPVENPPTACQGDPGWTLGHSVAWSPDGKRILVAATQDGSSGGTFGLVEFRSSRPFSTNASDWSGPQLMTDDSVSQEGVIAGAYSPDGTQVALVGASSGNGPELFLASARSFEQGSGNGKPYTLAQAQTTGIAACSVTWRSDSLALAVVTPTNTCYSSQGGQSGPLPGTISIVALGNPPAATETIAGSYLDSAWQPVPVPSSG
jgi:beta-lactam-binding protein with PASTA domain